MIYITNIFPEKYFVFTLKHMFLFILLAWRPQMRHGKHKFVKIS